MSTAVQVSCNRCLEPIACPMRLEFEESFRPLTEVSTGRYIPPDEFEGTTDELEDEALLINEQHILDLSEVVRQRIWLARPMYPALQLGGRGRVSKLDCVSGERPRGARWTGRIGVGGCADDETGVDPRWAALLDLKARLEDTDDAGCLRARRPQGQRNLVARYQNIGRLASDRLRRR